jgi:hypothetical protein
MRSVEDADVRGSACQERTPVERQARIALSHQLPPLRGAYGEPGLRAGRFEDMALIYPEMGS